MVEPNTPRPSEIAGLVLGAVFGFAVVVFLCALLAVQIRKVKLLRLQANSTQIQNNDDTRSRVSGPPSTYEFYAKELDSGVDWNIQEMAESRRRRNEADGREILQVE